MVALQVRMMHTLQDPPSFSQLMKEVREEDHWVTATDVKVSVAAVFSPQISESSELHNLKKEVKELLTKVNQLLSVTMVSSSSDRVTLKVSSQTSETVSRDQRPKPQRSSVPGIICYKCGEDEHKKWECKSPEYTEQPAGKLQRSEKEQHGAPDKTCSTNFSFPLGASQPKLPAGLVGLVSEVPVQIEGIYTKISS